MNTQRSQISPEDIAIKDITIEEKGGAQIASAEIDNDVPTLISLFNSTFEDYNTRLVLGDDEPIYIPAGDDTGYHQIVFAHGFFSSALHEIAHWCIAGDAVGLAPATAGGAGIARADVDGNGGAYPSDGAAPEGHSPWPLAGHANAKGLAACVCGSGAGGRVAAVLSVVMDQQEEQLIVNND